MEKSPQTLLENILALKNSPLFGRVPARDLEAVAVVADEVFAGPGETIVREGDVGDSMFLIKRGTVRVTKKINAGKTATLAEMKPGDCFGEMSAIDEEVRSASVIAQTEVALLRISKDALLDVILEAPHLGVELLKIFVSRLRAANGRFLKLSQAKEQGA